MTDLDAGGIATNYTFQLESEENIDSLGIRTGIFHSHSTSTDFVPIMERDDFQGVEW